MTLTGTKFESPAGARVEIEELAPGDKGGKVAEKGDEVVMSYAGTLLSDGSEFDASDRFASFFSLIMLFSDMLCWVISNSWDIRVVYMEVSVPF